MQPIQNISFPRSGHALLVRCLKQIYKDQINYCEFYTHCRKTPCSNPATNLQKNHDFDLRLQNSADLRYLIQYRHPIEAISSWFDLALKEPNVWERMTVWDRRWCWNWFFAGKVAYWKQFMEKWVLDNNAANVLLVSYHALVNDPRKQLERIANFTDPESPITKEKLDWVLKIQNIEPKKTVFDFRYCDRQWIEKTENGLAAYFDRSDLSRLT